MSQKLESFTINMRIKAIVSREISAESLEQALELARKESRPSIISKDYEYIDGSEEVIGVDGAWDID